MIPFVYDAGFVVGQSYQAPLVTAKDTAAFCELFSTDPDGQVQIREGVLVDCISPQEEDTFVGFVRNNDVSGIRGNLRKLEILKLLVSIVYDFDENLQPHLLPYVELHLLEVSFRGENVLVVLMPGKYSPTPDHQEDSPITVLTLKKALQFLAHDYVLMEVNRRKASKAGDYPYGSKFNFGAELFRLFCYLTYYSPGWDIVNPFHVEATVRTVKNKFLKNTKKNIKLQKLQKYFFFSEVSTMDLLDEDLLFFDVNFFLSLSVCHFERCSISHPIINMGLIYEKASLQVCATLSTPIVEKLWAKRCTSNERLPVSQGGFFGDVIGIDGDRINQVAEQLSTFLNKAEGFIGQTKQHAFDLAPKLVALGYVGVLCYALIKWYFEKDSSLMVQLGITSVMAICVFPTEIKELVLNLLNYKKVEAQSSFPHWETITSLLTLSTAFFVGLDLKTFKFKIKEIVPSISSLPKLSQGIKYALETLSDLFTTVSNYVREYIFGLHPILRDDSGIDQVDEFVKMAAPIIEKSQQVERPLKLQDYEDIIRMIKKGTKLQLTKTFGDRYIDNRVKKTIHDVMCWLEKARRPYDSSSLLAKLSRCEPYVILLRGAPGQGKSLAATLICKMIMALNVPGARQNMETFIPHNIFVRAPEVQYWDGYDGHYITLVDDFGQTTDIAGQVDSEYASLIRTVNSLNAPLHMAELTAKANTFFTSKFVVITTNHSCFSGMQSINFSDAFVRRFDMVLDVEVNKELDYEGEYKFARTNSDGKIVLDPKMMGKEALNFTRVKGVRDSTVLATHNFEGLMKDIMSGYKDKLDTFEEMIRKSDSMIEDICDSFTINPEPIIDMDDIELESDDDDVMELIDVPDSTAQNPELSKSWIPDYDSLFHHFWQEVRITHPNNFEALYKQSCDFFTYCMTPGTKMYQKILDVYDQGKPIIGSLIARNFEVARKNMVSFTSAIAKAKAKSKDAFDLMVKNSRKILGELSIEVRSFIKKTMEKYPGIKYLTLIPVIAIVIKLVFPWFTSKKNKKWKKEDDEVNEELISNIVQSGADVTGYAKKKQQQQEARLVIRYQRDGSGVMTPSAQGNRQETLNEVQRKIINKSSIVVCRKGIPGVWAHTCIIKGSIALIPSHYFVEGNNIISNDPEEEDSLLQFFIGNSVVPFKEVTLGDFLKAPKVSIENTDVTLYILPGRLKTFPDILKHFISSDELPSKYLDVDLVVKDLGHGYTQHVTEAIMVNQPLHYHNGSNGKYMVERYFSYRASTTFGDCGSILFASDINYYPSPILGMHVAALMDKSNQAYSNVLTREKIAEAIKFFDPIENNSPPINDFKYYKNDRFDFVHSTFRTASSTKLPIEMSSRTMLRKTHSMYEIFGECPVAPAAMAPYVYKGIRINPLTTATSRYEQTSPHIPEELILACAQDLLDEILANSTKFIYTELTFEEAVAGIPGVPYMDGLSRKTSAGYPFCKEKPPNTKGKQALFGKVGMYEFDSRYAETIKLEVDEILQNARQGKRMLHIYADFLKDELRPRAKVSKPRLVSCAPIQFSIAYRMVLLPVHSWFMINRIKNGFAVGINPYTEFTELAYHLQQDNPQSFIAGDFSGFDTRINSSFEKAVALIYKGVMRDKIEEDPGISTIIDILLMDIFSSVHIARDTVYYWTSGQPSGNPGTTIINCIINRILIRMCWVRVNNRNISTVKSYRYSVKDVVYGDDNVISVDRKAQDIFNPLSLSESMLEFNMVYTSEDKVSVIKDFRTIDQITFLKRSFVWDPDEGLMISPLDIDVVKYMMYYHRRSKNFKENIQMTYESFLSELALHGRETYLEMYEIIAPIMLEEFGYTARITGFEERYQDSLHLQLAY